MSVQHMVAVKFKPDLTQQRIAELFRQLHELWQKTPGVTYAAGGPYCSPEGLNQGYTHGFLVTFENAAARDSYLIDAGHERVKAEIISCIEAVVAFDFEAP